MFRNSTLLDLVSEMAREAGTEAEIVERVVSLVNSGRVRSSGSFRGARFDPAHFGRSGPAAGRIRR